MRALSFSQYTTLSAATGLPIPNGAEMAWIQAETANVRYRLDGGDPTAATGHIMRSNEPPIEVQSELEKMKFIQESAGAVLNVTYFG